MDKKIKGQGALEYLLLIGGAILVAVIVITILSGSSGQTSKQTEINALKGLCASKQIQAGQAAGQLCTTAGDSDDEAIGTTICDCRVSRTLVNVCAATGDADVDATSPNTACS